MTAAGTVGSPAEGGPRPTQVVNDPDPRQTSRRPPNPIVLGLAALVFMVQLTVLADTGDRGPGHVVDEFVAAFNGGDVAALDELMVAEPSMLSWPAGPPWGGVLQWTLELLPAGRTPTLTHSADFEAYVAYHRTLDGSLDLESCREAHRSDNVARRWVECRFAVSNELSRLLEPAAPTARGSVRFGVVGDRIDAVLVESWDRPAPSGVGLLLWMRTEHPADFEELLGSRVTVADYRPATAQAFLAYARTYAAPGT